MDRYWAGTALIFDIWDHFESHVVHTAEQLNAGRVAEFESTESSGVTLAIEVTKTPGGRGYSVVVESPDAYRGHSDGLRKQGWSLRVAGDHTSESDLRIERSCAAPRDVAATLSTTLRASLGISNPWFVGLAPADYSLFANYDESNAPFDPRAPMGPMDLLTSVGISLHKGYGPFRPMMIDGAFLVRSRTSNLLVRPNHETADVWFTWSVKSDVRGRRDAKHLVRRLNDQSLFANFTAEDDEVRAGYTLPADPLVSGHLYRVINSVGEAIASVLDGASGGAEKSL
ncbi:T3SS (YopN, CesT) and YbjN peptide-binding chaperone 1 [Rhodococcus sp. IEGM 1408]|uniref:T3SS (YopN, CesT) and YbjN peptide-binding chaperone 1 n=1 Tax=Rhodococcus sp. IEGM 1408 TaxID=3082220 RepID=UPI00295360E3|nr:hypothetical protein [Rhodococcus sp. IEGM 1408]MDV8003072.1 hypothetical protein [Rhodococcus sp. IEGM 1408]